MKMVVAEFKRSILKNILQALPLPHLKVIFFTNILSGNAGFTAKKCNSYLCRNLCCFQVISSRRFVCKVKNGSGIQDVGPFHAIGIPPHPLYLLFVQRIEPFVANMWQKEKKILTVRFEKRRGGGFNNFVMKGRDFVNYAGFLKEFITCPKKTGAIAPSSDRLSELITDIADLSNASSVFEFGPGTGVFTEKILKKLPEKADFIAIDSNANFVESTRQRCPKAKVFHDDAMNAGHYLKAHGMEKCDCIICGLPWASFGNRLQNELMQTILDILRPGGKFITFAYLQGLILPAGMSFQKKIRYYFHMVTITKPLWRNVPPALVYCAQR